MHPLFHYKVGFLFAVLLASRQHLEKGMWMGGEKSSFTQPFAFLNSFVATVACPQVDLWPYFPSAAVDTTKAPSK